MSPPKAIPTSSLRPQTYSPKPIASSLALQAVFTKNRPIGDLPQHVPAKPFAIVRNEVTHLMSPSVRAIWKAICGPIAEDRSDKA